jgi:radical SAM enzyme (TIGR01210 family)
MVAFGETKPLAAWRGRDPHDGGILDSLTVILHTRGCAYARCLMCGYRNERHPSADEEACIQDLEAQIRWVESRFPTDSYRMMKLYTSGSFFDPEEVPPRARHSIARFAKGKIVIVETRPEYVTAEAVGGFISGIDDGSGESRVFVAIGLETADDRIREKSIRKGFSFDDFRCAADTAHAVGAGVKTYLLQKPLFLTEKESITDMNESIRECAPFSDIISLNPCTVQRNTVLERCWRQGAYRPPYLWSVVSVLLDASVPVICDPVGAGKDRGPHNCGTCDRDIAAAIRDYSLTFDRPLLKDLIKRGCSCREEWNAVLELEMPFCMPLTR